MKIHNTYKLHIFLNWVKVKKSIINFAALILVVVIASYFIYNYYYKDPYQYSGDRFSYAKYRGRVDYNMILKEEKDKFKVYNINYESRPFMNFSTTIYGLLYIPKNSESKNVPAVIFLPGGGGSKESRAGIAEFIAEQGYVALIIDQRGIGETGGYYLPLEQDYAVSSKGNEPTQHLSVFDALKAFDVLSKIKGIDKENIAISGESMGGRYAIIAAGIDQRIRGVIGISTSGLHIKNENQPYTPYLKSIDPDNYVDKISPRYLILIHSTNDTLIKTRSAEDTLKLAKEPKKIYIIDNCSHGYCDKMQEDLKEALKLIFEN